MKEKTCFFTGHRILPKEEIPTLQKRLETEVEALILQGVYRFEAGGALGFDTLAAKTVLKWKKKYPFVRLILILPCKDQCKKWRQKDIETYLDIKQQADEVVYIAENYFDGCMMERNRRMVDDSGYCIYYQTRNWGGTAATLRYAASKALILIPLCLDNHPTSI